MRPFASVSVDLDPLECYYRIHGLGEPPAPLSDVILRKCLPRFEALFERHGIQATFFVVARDLDPDVRADAAESARDALARLVSAGHELGNHTYAHDYALGQASPTAVTAEIERADHLISRAGGAAVVGFRAPGYGVSATVLAELIRLGYRYDSSVFPAPAYYLAKAAVMGAMTLIGRRSGAVLSDPRYLLAPPAPYRPAHDAPWRRGDAPLLEFPIAVTPWGRMPAIGTSLVLAPAWLRSRWVHAMRKRPLFNLELHGIDLADAERDGIPEALVAKQPDLRVPLQRKLDALESILRSVRERHDLVRLCDVPESVLDPRAVPA